MAYISDSQLLDIIVDFTADRGFPPSLREIGDASGLSSTSSVWFRLRSLRDQGLVTWLDNQPRTLRVVTDE